MSPQVDTTTWHHCRVHGYPDSVYHLYFWTSIYFHPQRVFDFLNAWKNNSGDSTIFDKVYLTAFIICRLLSMIRYFLCDGCYSYYYHRRIWVYVSVLHEIIYGKKYLHMIVDPKEQDVIKNISTQVKILQILIEWHHDVLALMAKELIIIMQNLYYVSIF